VDELERAGMKAGTRLKANVVGHTWPGKAPAGVDDVAPLCVFGPGGDFRRALYAKASVDSHGRVHFLTKRGAIGLAALGGEGRAASARCRRLLRVFDKTAQAAVKKAAVEAARVARALALLKAGRLPLVVNGPLAGDGFERVRADVGAH